MCPPALVWYLGKDITQLDGGTAMLCLGNGLVTDVNAQRWHATPVECDDQPARPATDIQRRTTTCVKQSFIARASIPTPVGGVHSRHAAPARSEEIDEGCLAARCLP
jgi:hypothetical protein